MNFYTLAARINKSIDKHVELARQNGHEDIDEWRQTATTCELNLARRNMSLGIDLMIMFKELATEKGLTTDGPANRNYFVTIRPDESRISFEDFRELIHKFIQRKCVKKYTLSFEQKGTSEDTLGRGFHAHIVCHTTHRSKGELLRDAQSTFKSACAPNCIDVSVCKNPDSVVKNYLIDYVSEDGHKATTKEWDALWRERMGLPPVALSSPGRLQVLEELPS